MSITTNHDAARELYLYAANNWETCTRSIQPTAANMDRKRARGTFDPEWAAVAFASCAEFGARQYDIKPGDIVMVKRFGACKVLSTGPKNFKHNGGFDCIVITSSYAEIESIGGNSDGEEGEPEVTLDEFASKFS